MITYLIVYKSCKQLDQFKLLFDLFFISRIKIYAGDNNFQPQVL